MRQDTSGTPPDHALFQAIIEGSSVPVAALDRRHAYVALNTAYADAFERVFGRRPKPGAGLQEVLDHFPDQLASLLALSTRALAGERFTVERSFGDAAHIRRTWELAFAPVRDASGTVVAAAHVVHDATARRHAEADEIERQVEERTGALAAANQALRASEARLRRFAHHDPLTGLPNRTLLWDRLEQALAAARREGRSLAVLLLDLDHFKDVNDTLGHAAGDRLLRGITRRLAGVVRESDTLARLGGDEFALVQVGLRRTEDAAVLAGRIAQALAPSFDLDGQEMHAAASIGIALFPDDGRDGQALLRKADLALYRAKAEGRGRFRFFEPAMDAVAQERRRLERELRQALDRGEFVLHYQPQLNLTSGRFHGVEALLRWRHPERGLVLPGEFVPAAEASGLIRPLGAWVLGEACRQAAAWQQEGRPLTVAVNLSPMQLKDGDLLPIIGEALARVGLDPRRLELEITEGVLMETFGQEAGGFLGGLAARGIRLAIDDFGTGYSSLAYLRRLPVRKIKVDRSFVHDIGRDPEGEALVGAIVALGHSLGKRVTAEGVENRRQLAFLHAFDCDEAQGFLLARPRAPRALEDLLRGGGSPAEHGAALPSRASHLERQLAAADRRIAQAKAHIARQAQLVERLVASGRDTTEAEGLLEAIGQSLKHMRERRRQILREIGGG